MSTTIWDEGHVAACLCATDCDRCGDRRRCVQISVLDGGRSYRPPASLVNLCLKCFSVLTDEVFKAASEGKGA